MELERSTFPVRAALEYAISLVRERAAVHNIALTLDCESEIDVIDADELRFKQVVLNLLSNAVKFTPDGGHVSVRAGRKGDDLVVTVSDSGVGVPTEDRERIFESFQQGGRGATKEEGTGLGLTLCRRIVQLFGGEMWLESEVGAGSTFGFSIPMSGLTGKHGHSVSGQARRGRPLVVLIEDDRPSLDLLTVYLEAADLDVVSAVDGEGGLDAVRRLKPAAVVLDIRLPRLDGWEVLSALKADEDTAQVPVLIVSIVDERARGLALGAADYLIKPVGRDELLAALGRIDTLHIGPVSEHTAEAL